MRTPAQRGRYGRWLVRSREARGFDTAEKARAALTAAGIRIGKSTYAEYESGGKTPSRNHLPLLEQFWGPVPAEEANETPGLAAAIAEQARAISALAVQVEALVKAQPTGEELANVVAAAVGLAVRTTLQAAGRGGEPQRR